MRSEDILQDDIELNTPPIHWAWPTVPQKFTLYDKYANVSVCLALGDTTWTPSVQGSKRKFIFLAGKVGIFQQKLVLLTQGNFSPSSFYKFTFTILRHWSVFVELLETQPNDIKSFWDRKILTIDLAKAAKSILKLCAHHSLGPWHTVHQNLIAKLSTRANSTVAAQRDRIEKRSKLIATSSQIDIVRLLDEKAGSVDLLEWQIEGLTALMMGFQHGVRPVQLLSLLTSHIHLLNENDGKVACIISFHEAKKKGSNGNLEMSRQVKPDWAPLILALLDLAALGGRDRLFSTTTSKQLWSNTKRVCKHFGILIKYNYYNLRHTGAQTLSDAGHGSSDIQNFLGHAGALSGLAYIRSSRKHIVLINKALGISKIYSTIESLANKKSITVNELQEAKEDQQIAGVVGNRLVAGIGLCSTGQQSCFYDPVTSCYNCKKYIPVINPDIHQEAIAGLRQQVLFFFKTGIGKDNPAYLQLTSAIAGAQEALALSQKVLSQNDKKS